MNADRSSSARFTSASSNPDDAFQSGSQYSRSHYGTEAKRVSKRRAAQPNSVPQAPSAPGYSEYADRSRYARGSARTADAAGTADDFSSAPRMSRYHYAAQRKSKRRRNILIAVAVVLVLVLGAGGAAFAYLANINSNLHQGLGGGIGSLVKSYSNSDPFYVLLMGTDGSKAREESGNFDGDEFRTDSIMLVRVDPSEKKVTMVSILRDTYVDMGEYGQNKINAAHALGGADLAVKTVSELAGVDINHYAEINFDGFKSIVDALGGIEVNVPMEIDDDEAGGHLDAGKQTLNGDQALILCRSRHTYDEYGKGDEYRAANQRLVLSAIAKKLLQSDATTIASTVSALSEYVTTDFTVNELVGLAQTMRGLDTENDIYTGTEPTESVYINDQWYELVDVDAWTAMMERINQGLPPNEEDLVDEATGIVFSSGSGVTGSGSSSGSSSISLKGRTATVLNGNGVSGSSSSAASLLEEAGMDAATDNADSFDHSSTVVIYAPSIPKEEAQAVADILGVGTVLEDDGSYSYVTDFLVILGSDFE